MAAQELTLEVSISYVPAHYNRNAQAMIPGSWEAEVISGLPQPRSGHRYAYYMADSRKEALAGLIADLRERGLSGSICLV